MYHYTQEQLESMKKVEASRASRIEKLHARMTAEEKDAVLAEFHPDYITSAYEELKVGKNSSGIISLCSTTLIFIFRIFSLS